MRSLGRTRRSAGGSAGGGAGAFLGTVGIVERNDSRPAPACAPNPPAPGPDDRAATGRIASRPMRRLPRSSTRVLQRTGPGSDLATSSARPPVARRLVLLLALCAALWVPARRPLRADDGTNPPAPVPAPPAGGADADAEE